MFHSLVKGVDDQTFSSWISETLAKGASTLVVYKTHGEEEKFFPFFIPKEKGVFKKEDFLKRTNAQLVNIFDLSEIRKSNSIEVLRVESWLREAKEKKASKIIIFMEDDKTSHPLYVKKNQDIAFIMQDLIEKSLEEISIIDVIELQEIESGTTTTSGGFLANINMF